MAVEIVILTGSRQGERQETELLEFRAGSAAECEIAFDPHLDPGAAGRLVLFRLNDNGWSIENLGQGKPLVNDTPILEARRIRSGNVVRLSDNGPDFAFQIRPWTGSSVAPMTTVSVPHQSTQPAKPRYGRLVGSVVVVILVLAVTWVASSFMLRAPDEPPPAVVADRNNRHSEPDKVPPDKPPTPPGSPDKPPTPPGSPNSKVPPSAMQDSKSPLSTPKSDVPVPSPPGEPKPPAEDNPWALALDRAREAIYLLEAEKPVNHTVQSYSFAVAVAVGEDTLLTSGNVAVGLTQFQQQGWKVWATNEALNIKKMEVSDWRVHIGYADARLEDDRNNLPYFDQAVLTVRGKLPKLMQFADDRKLEPGFQLGFITIPHDEHIGDKFRKYSPHVYPGELLGMTALDQSPGSPLLLHLKADIPSLSFGSPIVDRQGRLIAVVGDPSVPPGQENPDPRRQHAAVVEAELVRQAWNAEDSKFWVKPRPTTTLRPSPQTPAPTPAARPSR